MAPDPLTTVMLFFEVVVGVVVLIVFLVMAGNVGNLVRNSRVIVAQLDLLLRAQGVPEADRQNAYQSANQPTGATPDPRMKN